LHKRDADGAVSAQHEKLSHMRELERLYNPRLAELLQQ
jgi:hypothetical protein